MVCFGCIIVSTVHKGDNKVNNRRIRKVKVKVIPQQAEVAQGVPGSLRPPDFRNVRHYKGGRWSAIRAGRLYPRRNPWYSFSVTDSTPGHVVLSVGATEKIPSDTIGNRSRDGPTSSAVP